ncbi:folylpolyglutamate synthase [Anaeramoeba ignava]|uniref:Folylpolyglutamate synthase n=1 Tax=Anaeramoeba ignava TaxID=1746090 RepID=A0A9Q0LRI6_ANAIG|nr:folylpolyglutamate synthase [Anaeramoeba ignava]
MQIKTYKQAIERLSKLQSNQKARIRMDSTFSGHNSLSEMDHYIESLELSLQKLSVIHVAGTKGKGSTCAFVESILRNCGLRTGLYISPHLVDIRERIVLNGNMISKEDFAEHFFAVYNKLEQTRTPDFPELPSFFRFMTLFAFHYFLHQKVDVAIIEVGIGGRYDSTNVVFPTVCGVSSLGFDHMSILGDTLDKIAFEKAGIFKRNVVAVTSPQKPIALKTLKETATSVGSPLFLVPDLSAYSSQNEIILSLEGDHQKINASLAITLAKFFLQLTFNVVDDLTTNLDWQKYLLVQPFQKTDEIFQEDLSTDSALEILFANSEKGLSTTSWPGRCQVCPSKKSENVIFYLDGAHTDESIGIAVNWFANKTRTNETETTENSSVKILLFFCTSDRDPKNLLQPLIKMNIFHHVIFSPHIPVKKAAKIPGNWLDLMKEIWESSDPKAQIYVEKTLSSSLSSIYSISENFQDVLIQVLVTGSLHIVGDVLSVEHLI